MAGHEVRVEVGQDDVLDREAIPRCVVDVLADVPTRVDDDGGARPLVADQVRGLRQTAEVVLLEDHLSPSLDHANEQRRCQRGASS